MLVCWSSCAGARAGCPAHRPPPSWHRPRRRRPPGLPSCRSLTSSPQRCIAHPWYCACGVPGRPCSLAIAPISKRHRSHAHGRARASLAPSQIRRHAACWLRLQPCRRGGARCAHTRIRAGPTRNGITACSVVSLYILTSKSSSNNPVASCGRAQRLRYHGHRPGEVDDATSTTS